MIFSCITALTHFISLLLIYFEKEDDLFCLILHLLLFTIRICIYIDFNICFLAIVPIEYFSERNGAGSHTNGSKIKSLNEENRV